MRTGVASISFVLCVSNSCRVCLSLTLRCTRAFSGIYSPSDRTFFFFFLLKGCHIFKDMGRAKF